MGLEISKYKTKYMVISRNSGNAQDLIVDNYTFQAVTDIKYLGTNINNANNMHNEIKLRVAAANKGCFALEKLFKSKLLSIKSKSTLYATICDQFYPMDAKRGQSLRGMKRNSFERKLLRRIYGP